MIRYFYLGLFSIFCALHIFSPVAMSSTAYNEVEIAAVQFNTPQLCGVYATYIMLSLTGQKKPFGDIFDSFPGSASRGITLKDMHNYFTRMSIKSRIQWLSEIELADSGVGIAAVLYSDGDMPHIVVKRARKTDLQIIDPLSEPSVLEKVPTERKRRPSLLLIGGKNPESLFARLWQHFWLIGVMLIMVGGVIFAFIRRVNSS